MFLFFLFWRFFVNSRQVNCQISGCRPSRVCRNLKLNNHLSLGSNDWGQKPTDLNILLAITLPKATLVWSADVDSQVSSRVRSSKLIFFLSMTTRRGQNPPSPHLMIVSSRRLWARPMWRAKPISLPVTSQSSLVSNKKLSHIMIILSPPSMYWPERELRAVQSHNTIRRVGCKDRPWHKDWQDRIERKKCLRPHL